mmetsp:Transcript_33758/g.99461  ORF Transcript_33758/g.99461 Transcript_33758/m.99461 type:complete len:98 (-) Transcript_33758:130-423(-)
MANGGEEAGTAAATAAAPPLLADPPTAVPEVPRVPQVFVQVVVQVRRRETNGLSALRKRWFARGRVCNLFSNSALGQEAIRAKVASLNNARELMQAL